MLSSGGQCSACGFRYFEHKGHIIQCPRCKAEQLERELAEARREIQKICQQQADADAAREHQSASDVRLPRVSTVEIQDVICDQMFSADWRTEDVRFQGRCRSEAADLYDAIIALADTAGTQK